MKLKICAANLALILLFLTVQIFAATRRNDTEFTGQLDAALVADTEDFEKIVFKYASNEILKDPKNFGENSHLAVSRLYNPQTGEVSLLSVLVEEKDKNPVIFVDLNGDNAFSSDEKFVFQPELKDNPYLWNVTVNLPVKNGFFTSCPIFLRYFKDVQIEKMSSEDRLVTQSTDVLARGTVDVKGKKVLVQYAYSFADKKITPKNGWQGVDSNEDGKIDMNALSYEAAKASDETVIFRVGQTFLSTESVDLKKNQIVMREHTPDEYKRIELEVGKEIPNFTFTDLDGKKRNLSEFRGKYVLLDFWGLWCPACVKELPFMLEAYKRFQNRKLEIVGMNTDKFAPADIKKALSSHGLNWTQASRESFMDLLNYQFRIESFPSTFLISPEGRLLSMSRTEKDELDLRGEDLLKTLDKVLPR